MEHFFNRKFLLPILWLAIILLVACSEKEGKIKGIFQSSTLAGIEVPLVGLETFDYKGTDTCILNQSNSLTPLALKQGTRVEVLEEATCSEIIYNEETGVSSTFLTSISKVRFPSPTNVGNATGGYTGGVGSFWELWTFTSAIQITEVKLRSDQTISTGSSRADKIQKQKSNNGSSPISMQGILQDMVVLILLDEISETVNQSQKDDCYVKKNLSNRCIERKVPLSIWTEMEETLQTYTRDALKQFVDKYSGKEAFCLINEHKQEAGTPFEIGAKVEIIALASNDCQRVMLMRPGSPIMKFPTSLVKIRVLDGKDKGLEGWTWTGAVKQD